MIRSIEIRDLVVIARAEITPGPGVTAITGESGAGKSVLARALGLLLGAPADADEVRPGARAALVQATLALPEAFWDTLDEDDPAAGLAELVDDPREVVVARRIPAEGRARALVDGQAVPREAVASLTRSCLRVVGQSEARRLVSPAAQLAALDAFAGDGAVALARALGASRRRLAAVDRRLARARDARAERAREREELEELVDAVRSAGLDAEEAAALRLERERLRHAGRLLEAAAVAAEAVSAEGGDGGALQALGVAERALSDVAALDPALAGPRDEIASAAASLQEAALALRGYAAGLEADPGRLQALEDRLADYARIDRRYGPGLDEVLARAEAAEARLEELAEADEDMDRLGGQRAEALAEATALAERLSAVRAQAAPELETALAAELAGLAMPHAEVRVTLGTAPGAPPVGTCAIALQVNPGLPPAPLADAVSGGELSRTLLALHSLAAAQDEATWVFDEVDAGVGGETAAAVGRRLAHLGEGRQVIVITHLPQVAALADDHYRLVKGVDADGTALTTVEPVAGADLVGELCRMLGAAPDDAGARRHAKELLARRTTVGRAA